MRYLIFPVAALMAAAWSPSAARAGHDSPLYEAADHYRDAVKHFEDDVQDADYFNRYDEKLVDQLEDATSHLRSAARDLDHLDRLFYEWDEVQSLQPRVERAIFGRRCYPPHPQLMGCWEDAQIAYGRLAREMHVIRGRPFCVAPEVCNGQCGYHSGFQPGGAYDHHGPARPGGYGYRWDRSSPGAIDRREEFVRRDGDRTLAVPRDDRRRASHRPGPENHRARRRMEGRDVGAAVVGSLMRGLLD